MQSHSTRKPSNAVFIGNLPFDASEQMLHDIFAEIGPIKSMRWVQQSMHMS